MTSAASELLSIGAIRVAVHATGGGRPLLLLPGLGTDLDGWSPLLAELDGQAVLAFDPPGVGASPPWATTGSIPAMASLTEQILDELGHDEVDVLGFSWGGLVAQQLAVSAPDRVRRLCLVSTSFGIGSVPASPLAFAATALEHTARGLRLGLDDATGLAAQWFAACSWSTLPTVCLIAQPTLVIAGTTDRLVPPANSRLLARLIRNSQLVLLPDIGHDLPTRAAPVLAGEVAEFLAVD